MEILAQVVATIGVIVGIVATVLLIKHPYLGLWSYWLAAGCALTATFCFIHDNWRKKDLAGPSVKEQAAAGTVADTRKSDETKAVATLVPGYKDSSERPYIPHEIRIKELSDSEAALILGSSVVHASAFPHPVILQETDDLAGAEEMLVLDLHEGKLLVSAKFFNKEGKIICELVRNAIHINPATNFRVESSQRRLTVFDHEARKVVDVEFITPRVVSLLGDYYLRNNHRVLISREKQEIVQGFEMGYRYFTNAMPEFIVPLPGPRALTLRPSLHDPFPPRLHPSVGPAAAAGESARAFLLDQVSAKLRISPYRFIELVQRAASLEDLKRSLLKEAVPTPSIGEIKALYVDVTGVNVIRRRLGLPEFTDADDMAGVDLKPGVVILP